ncbi:MAG: MarR family winged helix-turn-helix transcriptional regulator [Actinomycetales bacterium]
MPAERRLATEFARPEESPGFLLWQVTNRWQQAQRATLKAHDLTHVQFVLLATLSWQAADGPVTQKQLADAAATDPMMTSQVLRALELKGLVERAPHPADGRARALRATRAGRALADRAVVDVERCDGEFFSILGAKGTHDFARALRLLAR